MIEEQGSFQKDLKCLRKGPSMGVSENRGP